MIGKNLVQSVFPRPRRPISIRDTSPLIIFLSLFVGLCIYLELSNLLTFVRPSSFSLLLVTVWIWWMYAAGHSGLPRIRSLVALFVRLVLVGLFVMLLAEPRAVRTSDILSVVYTLDISDSIGDRTTDRALEFVSRTVGEKPGTDEAGLVVFGRNAAVELPPRISYPFDELALNSSIDRDATNLQQSLSLAAAMLPEENRGRIVLISDGTETAGSMSQTLEELKSRGIAVDVLPIQYDYQKEVWIERLELPQFVKLGEEYEASIILSSLQNGSGRLILRENGAEISSVSIKYNSGKNRRNLKIGINTPGYYEYSATIETESGEDHLSQNNTALNYIYVEGEGKVLIVTDPQSTDSRDWESLAQAIREGERFVEQKSAYDFPRDPMSLMPYDTVVFVNVAADAFDAVQLRTMRDAVYNLGTGFLMVGGANSFGPGGYHRTVIEESLPVTMDITKKKVLPKGALAIILHTCEFPEGNTWGKRITKQAIKVLGDQDDVGVLAYEGTEKWIVEMTSAKDYESIAPKINAAQIGDMPSFSKTMELGLKGLIENDAATKHMIIISDGDPSPPPPPLIKKYIDNEISISMVAIFPHGGEDISKMRAVTGSTGGRYYFPATPDELPSIFIKEAKTLKRSMIQNKTISPQFQLPSSIVKGIDALPDLHGYVLTSPKPRAEVILRSPPEDESEGDVDPILATWRYGLGTTSVFTSDLSPNWGADWVQWEKYRAFVKQLMTKISRVRKDGHLKMWTYTTGSEGVINVEDFHPEESFLEIQARVSGPRDKSQIIPLKQIGPRRYQATIPLWGKGRYQVMASGMAGDRKDQAYGGFLVPYSPEYLKFRSNPIALKEIVNKTAGDQLSPDSTAKDIFGRREPKKSSRPVFDWFLFALAILIPLDVGVRRIQLDWFVIKGWLGLGRKKGDSTKTMGALLDRKQQVDSRIESQKTKLPSSPTSSAVKPRQTHSLPDKPKSPTKQQKTHKDLSEEQENRSTTERLLDIKRRKE